MALLGD